ncbi:MAG TPA: methanogenesis marker 17 protein [Methanomassiliicoccales archaeon]|jgi:putative methanogenesis marker protein 17|nr:methanogenesis marker 17 protein [Methanomassiliicoccales archaeon]MCE5261254.1 methanogenesis marker 17 protein [Euryarchaeota archaeon]HOE53328.1 methanogenesis marker 17 protein [Methanomassiliicoccales archaeon]HOO03712.1 methanogenesis marker 17 protein [Methanomassiliicoccales archaeon]HRU11473.1 methanogenesis marker 17 protein [Methanomassiliicoccales archaeon]
MVKFELEGTERYALESYQWLLERILIDMGITTMVERVRLIIRPDQTLFIISMRIKQAGSKRPVSDIADMEAQEGGTFITIKDESYAPRLLASLWRMYGRERVQQLTRLEIFVDGVPVEELSDLKLDPEEEVRSQLLDAMWRLLPEGLKVRNEYYNDNVMTIVATEHGMTVDFLAEAQKVHSSMVQGKGED